MAELQDSNDAVGDEISLGFADGVDMDSDWDWRRGLKRMGWSRKRACSIVVNLDPKFWPM